MTMNKMTVALVYAGILSVGAAIAACGGGGAGAIGGPGPTPTPTVSPSTSPSSSPAPGLLGGLNVTTGGTVAGGFTTSPAGNDNVVFTCGCTNQAGTTTTDSGGNFTVTSPAMPTPGVPNPTFTIVPTRNYLVIAQPSATAGPQAWTIVFAGTVASHDLALGDGATPAPATSAHSDVYTTAAALYIYKNSTQNSNTAFDDWNLNTIQTWVGGMVTSPNTAERKLLDDIATEGGTGSSLYVTVPGWNSSEPLAATVINSDLASVKTSTDPNIPTPCPGGEGTCTNTPTP